MKDIEAIEILKQMRKDTPTISYECLMNKEMEALDTILLSYEVMCNECKNLQEENEKLKEICSDLDIKIKGLKEIRKGKRTLEQYKTMLKHKDKDTLIEWIYNLSSKICAIEDELTADRMEQFDDYVIYLQTKYLEILGGNDG